MTTSRWQQIIPWLVIFVTLATLFSMGYRSGGAPRSIIGLKTPDFTATTYTGELIKSPEYFSNNSYTVVHFWTVNCPTCREESLEYREIWDDFLHCDNQKLCPKILSVNIQDSLESVQEFTKKFKLPYSSVIDNDASIARGFGVLGVPETFIVDNNGVVQEHLAGETSRDEIARTLEMLQQKPITASNK